MPDDSKRKLDHGASDAEAGAPPFDPERIAALLDGRLDDEARAKLLATIAESDEAFEILVEASAALRMEAPEVPAAVLQGPASLKRSHANQRPLRWLAAAAAVAGVALAPWGWSAMRGDRSLDPGRFSAAVTPTATQVASIASARPWSANRGSSIRTAARGARIGVYVTDIEIALRTATAAASTASATVDQLISELLSLLATTPNAGPAVQAYTEVRDQGNDSLRALRTRNARIAAVSIDPGNVELGAWAETALYGALTHDSAFFASPETAKMLARAPGSTSAAIIREFQSANRSGPFRWTALEDDVRRLIREITE